MVPESARPRVCSNQDLGPHCEGDTATKPLYTRTILDKKGESTRYRHVGTLMQRLSSVYIVNSIRYMSRLYLTQQLSSEIKLRSA